jgi:hypothetical protein
VSSSVRDSEWAGDSAGREFSPRTTAGDASLWASRHTIRSLKAAAPTSWSGRVSRRYHASRPGGSPRKAGLSGTRESSVTSDQKAGSLHE